MPGTASWWWSRWVAAVVVVAVLAVSGYCVVVVEQLCSNFLHCLIPKPPTLLPHTPPTSMTDGDT